jgi:hypothetical protein
MTLEYLYRYVVDMAFIAPLRERRNVPDIQTALLQYFIYNGGSDERIRRNEDNATAPGHAMNAGVEKPTFGLGIGGIRIHVVRRGA